MPKPAQLGSASAALAACVRSKIPMITTSVVSLKSPTPLSARRDPRPSQLRG